MPKLHKVDVRNDYVAVMMVPTSDLIIDDKTAATMVEGLVVGVGPGTNQVARPGQWILFRAGPQYQTLRPSSGCYKDMIIKIIRAADVLIIIGDRDQEYQFE
jgi:hypothetical protein